MLLHFIYNTPWPPKGSVNWAINQAGRWQAAKPRLQKFNKVRRNEQAGSNIQLMVDFSYLHVDTASFRRRNLFKTAEEGELVQKK